MKSVYFNYDVPKKLESERGNSQLERLADVTSSIQNGVRAVSMLPSTRVSADWTTVGKRSVDEGSVYFSVRIETPNRFFKDVTSLFIGMAGLPYFVSADEADYEIINQVLSPYNRRLSTFKEDFGSPTKTLRALEVA